MAWLINDQIGYLNQKFDLLMCKWIKNGKLIRIKYYQSICQCLPKLQKLLLIILEYVPQVHKIQWANTHYGRLMSIQISIGIQIDRTGKQILKTGNLAYGIFHMLPLFLFLMLRCCFNNRPSQNNEHIIARIITVTNKLTGLIQILLKPIKTLNRFFNFLNGKNCG